jgi:hypothetical protein
LGITSLTTLAVPCNDAVLALPVTARVGTLTLDSRPVGMEPSIPRTALSYARVGAIDSRVDHIGECRIPWTFSAGTPTNFMNKATASLLLPAFSSSVSRSLYSFVVSPCIVTGVVWRFV